MAIRAAVTSVALVIGFGACSLTVELPEPTEPNLAAGPGAGSGGAGGDGGESPGEPCDDSSDCEPPDSACDQAVCVVDLELCATTHVPKDGLPLGDVDDPLGDCQIKLCNGLGGVGAPTADSKDTPDPESSCTSYECQSGVLFTEFLLIGSDCEDGVCDLEGDCVECNAPNDCLTLPPDDECQMRTCGAGACGQSFTAENVEIVNAALQVDGDCKVKVCDGDGGMVDIDDDLDTPPSGLCTIGTCNSGTPGSMFRAQGDPCGVGLTCDNMGNCMGCTQNSECGTDTTCLKYVCTAMQCDENPEPAGSHQADLLQIPKDCQVNECDGAGAVRTVALDTELPADDGNDCTDEACNMGMETHPDEPINTACSLDATAGGFCNGFGDCVECNAASQCGNDGNECLMPICEANVCDTDPLPDGTPSPDQVPMDCKLRVCNGAGAVVEQNQDTDVQVDGNQCTNDICSSGTPQHPNAAAGTACTQMGGSVCNGNGSCVECVTDSHCPTNKWCDSSTNTCQADRGQGGGCLRKEQCSTNFCVDNFCCNMACTELCVACSMAKTGFPNGTCGPVTSRTDPDDECTGIDGVCQNGMCCSTGGGTTPMSAPMVAPVDPVAACQ